MSFSDFAVWKDSLDRYCPNCYNDDGYTIDTQSYCHTCGWQGPKQDNITHDVAFKKMRKEKLKYLNKKYNE